ncbi:hypothetical protein DV737_g969, partial [Chaetothyriales sp. CBS 132003]
MAAQSEPEIVLYDLASTKNTCFSPAVWRIRLMLNYKQIPYRTVFLELHDIEPALKGLGIAPNPDPAARIKYTVPVIHHLPSNTYLMDSVPISHFLQSAYPSPPLTLTSELGRTIETKGRETLGVGYQTSLTPREIHIFSPAAQAYFRRSREAWLGHPLEHLLSGDKEEQVWKSLEAGPLPEYDELLRTNAADGPFVLGKTPSITDFFIVGSLEMARAIDERVFEKLVAYPGCRAIYDACQPYMQKRD